MTATKPPVGDTICDGKYRIVETLRDGVAQGLHRGVEVEAPTRQVLVTTLLASETLDVDLVKSALVADAPGRFAFEALSFFDIRGTDSKRNIYQEQNLALVEGLPSGDWVGRLLDGSFPPLNSRDVNSLGLSTGRILLRAAEHGVLMSGARPEYIWAERNLDGILIATGISDRYQNFLQFTGAACSLPAVLLRRTYLAPEIHWKKPPTLASLTFSLAAMMAEWSTGQYPFFESWMNFDITTLLRGDHIPLEVSPQLAQLLHLGMRPDPDSRPSLPAFLAALEALFEENPTS